MFKRKHSKHVLCLSLYLYACLFILFTIFFFFFFRLIHSLVHIFSLSFKRWLKKFTFYGFISSLTFYWFLTAIFLQQDGSVVAHQESDCLISQATVRGYSAFRNQMEGMFERCFLTLLYVKCFVPLLYVNALLSQCWQENVLFILVLFC